MFEPALSGVRQADGAGVAHTRQPFHLDQAGKQGSPNGASNVVVALRPIQALMCEGTPLFAQGVGIDVKSM
jgi:hypothetical protein